MEGCKCKPAKSYAERIIEYQEFISLVRRMREARHKYSALLREFHITGIEPRQSWELQEARKLTKKLESEVDKFLMKLEDMKSSWIKVSDRLPEAKYRTDIEKGYSEVVLICGFHYTPTGNRCRFSDVAYYDHEYRKWYDQYDESIAGGVTHWMPIELPEED